MAKLIGAQPMVLQAILDAQRETQNYIEDSQIAQSTRIALNNVRHWLETIEREGYVEVARTEVGLSASITALGSLALEQFRTFQSEVRAAGRTDWAPVSDGGQDGDGLSRPFGQVPQPGSPTAQNLATPRDGGDNAPDGSKRKTPKRKRRARLNETLPGPRAAQEGEVAAASAGSSSGKVEARGDGSEPSGAHDNDRWRAYRGRIRGHIEGFLGTLGRDEGQGQRMLGRVAGALGIASVQDDEDRLKKRITAVLLDAEDEHTIPKLVRLHVDLSKEGSSRAADGIADCVDLILPLYLSREAVDRAWRQLQFQKAVLIEGTVARETGAEILMAGVDGERTCFLPHVPGEPRGKNSIPFEPAAIGDLSLDAQVLAVLRDLATGTGVPLGKARSEGGCKDVAARTEHLKKELCGWLGPAKDLTGRTHYCALAIPETPVERENLKKILKKVRELVPPLVFIELDSQSPTLEREMYFIRCLNTRFNLNK